MDNIIFNDNNNNTIGYYKDLRKYLEKQGAEYLATGDYEQAKDMADLLLDLNGWADNESLLVISDNNGMGYTIKEYEKGD